MKKIILSIASLIMVFWASAQVNFAGYHGKYGEATPISNLETKGMALGDLSYVVAADAKIPTIGGFTNTIKRIVFANHNTNAGSSTVNFNNYAHYTYVNSTQNTQNKFDTYFGDGYVVNDVIRIENSSPERFALCGYVEYTDLSGSSTVPAVNRGFVMVVDANGNPQWYREYQGGGFPLVFSSMVNTTNGNIMLCGSKKNCSNVSAVFIMVTAANGTIISNSAKEFSQTGFDSEYNQVIRIRGGITSSHPGTFALVGTGRKKVIPVVGTVCGDILVSVIPFESTSSGLAIFPVVNGSPHGTTNLYTKSSSNIYLAETGKTIAYFEVNGAKSLIVGSETQTFSNGTFSNKKIVLSSFDIANNGFNTDLPTWNKEYNIGLPSISLADMKIQTFTGTIPPTNQNVTFPIINVLVNSNNGGGFAESGILEVEGLSGSVNTQLTPGGYTLSCKRISMDGSNNIFSTNLLINPSRSLMVSSFVPNASNQSFEVFSAVKKNVSASSPECNLQELGCSENDITFTKVQNVHVTLTATFTQVTMVKKTLSLGKSLSACAADFEECACSPAILNSITRVMGDPNVILSISNGNICSDATYNIVLYDPFGNTTHSLDIKSSIPLNSTLSITINLNNASWVNSNGINPDANTLYLWKLITVCPDGQSFAIGDNVLKSNQTNSSGINPVIAPSSSPSFNQNAMEPEEEKLLNLFPNPASEELTIDFFAQGADVGVSIDILNSQSQLIQQVITNEKRCNCRQTIQTDISGLSSGMYYLRITQGETSEYKKFVVNR
jgi:Secretion system C-terminal sorting domain